MILKGLLSRVCLEAATLQLDELVECLHLWHQTAQKLRTQQDPQPDAAFYAPPVVRM